MKLPYGISDFKALREQGYLYIDKTQYIAKLEGLSSKYIFFIRPRRFGKSLFLSMFEHYYDINAATDFEELFEGLYISQNPTSLKNSYLVLKLNFSALSAGNKDVLQKSFNTRVARDINSFIKKYRRHIPEPSSEQIDTSSDASASFKCLIDMLKGTGKKIYLIIDEYDHFANNIIAMGESDFYKDIVRASGFVRDFYEAVKIGTESVIDRIFITGASPVMLDDLTSGFNIARNLTINAALNEMLGFTENDVRQIVDKMNINRDKVKLMDELRFYYNGYLFNENGTEKLYNPDMVLNFFAEWEISHSYPEQLIDANVKSDYGKIQRLIGNEENKTILEKIIKDEYIEAQIATEFSFDTMYDNEYFVSLLFYMGMLTIDRQEVSRTVLKAPNYVIKTIYWGYIEKNLRREYKIIPDVSKLGRAIEEMAFRGKLEPYVEYICTNVLKLMSNRDLIDFDEKYIKMLMFTYLVSSKAYSPISEREVENGYVDIYLERDARMPNVRYEWVIELKYVKKAEARTLEEVKQGGLRQLEKYVSSRGFEGKGDLRKALVVFVGKDEFYVVE